MTAESRPERVQLRRTRGWRKPADAVVVARPSSWGNPYPVAQHGRQQAVERYRQHLQAHPELIEKARTELRGRSLACWCPPGESCHADVLLEVANTPTPQLDRPLDLSGPDEPFQPFSQEYLQARETRMTTSQALQTAWARYENGELDSQELLKARQAAQAARAAFMRASDPVVQQRDARWQARGMDPWAPYRTVEELTATGRPAEVDKAEAITRRREAFLQVQQLERRALGRGRRRDRGRSR